MPVSRASQVSILSGATWQTINALARCGCAPASLEISFIWLIRAESSTRKSCTFDLLKRGMQSVRLATTCGKYLTWAIFSDFYVYPTLPQASYLTITREAERRT